MSLKKEHFTSEELPLRGERFITRNELKELLLSFERVEQSVDDVKKSNRALREDAIAIRNEFMDELVDSLTFRVFLVVSLFGSVQLIFKIWW